MKASWLAGSAQATTNVTCLQEQTLSAKLKPPPNRCHHLAHLLQRQQLLPCRLPSQTRHRLQPQAWMSSMVANQNYLMLGLLVTIQ